MNIYSDSSHSTLKYLKDTEANICNLLIITGDFNIRNSLDLSSPISQVLTRYSNNINNSNSVIDLMFLRSSSSKLNNHSIHPNWCLISDNTPLPIPIVEEDINSTKHSIIKDSKEEVAFIKDITISIRNLHTSNLSDITSLDNIVNEFANMVKSI